MNVGDAQWLGVLLMIPCHEEVQAVFDDRSTQRETILIGGEIRGTFVAEDVVLAGEPVGAEIGECRTLEGVGTRLGYGVDESATRTAVGYIVGIGYHLELSHGLHGHGVRTAFSCIGSTAGDRVLG